MISLRNGLSLAAALGLVVAAPTAPADAQDFYKGKAISVIVGFGPGGIDTAARIFMKNLGKHIPGNPKIVVKNMPGAASLKSANFMKDKARPDGLTVSYNSWQSVAELVRAPGVRFSYSDFVILGGVSSQPSVTIARTDLVPGGIKKGGDILKASGLKYQGRNASHGLDIEATTALQLLGAKYLYIPGIRSGGALRQSIQSGQTNVTGLGFSLYSGPFNAVVRDGTVFPLWYYPRPDGKGGFAPDPANYGKIKPFTEVYKEVHGKMPSGKLWDEFIFFRNARGTMSQIFFAPPGLAADKAEILRKAFQAAAKDSDTLATLNKVYRGNLPSTISAQRARTAVEAIANAGEDRRAFWKARTKRAPRKGKKGKK